MQTLTSNISVNPATGISQDELMEALPDFMQAKYIHLHWVAAIPAGRHACTLMAKIMLNEQTLLLQTVCKEPELITGLRDDPSLSDENYPLLALDRILTDPANEDTLISL